jgi:hypothetical protein
LNQGKDYFIIGGGGQPIAASSDSEFPGERPAGPFIEDFIVINGFLLILWHAVSQQRYGELTKVHLIAAQWPQWLGRQHRCVVCV